MILPSSCGCLGLAYAALNNSVCTEQIHLSIHSLQNITLNHTNTQVKYSSENKITFHIRRVYPLTAHSVPADVSHQDRCLSVYLNTNIHTQRKQAVGILFIY